MEAEDRLRFIDQRVANLIRQTDDPVALRLFACECAELALSRCSSPDPRSVRAVHISRQFARGRAKAEMLERARRAAEKAARSIQRRADEVGLAVKMGEASKADHIALCYYVCGSESAFDCTDPSPTMAATMAAYMSSHAHTGDLYKESKRARAEQNNRLTAIAERILGQSKGSDSPNRRG